MFFTAQSSQKSVGYCFASVELVRFSLSLIALFFVPAIGAGQSDFQRPPIAYDQATATDAIARLSKAIESGEVQLDWDVHHGWLPSLLEKLDVPASSQTLVFSKTSMQIEHISPSNPRALYFNDEIYIGAVPGAPRIEMSAVDPKLGAVFYTIDNEKSSDEVTGPTIARDQHECLRCHATGKTQDVPGFLIRSVYPGRSGHPRYELGTTTTDHTTPLKDRFGGWYVTGTLGSIRHRGNAFATSDKQNPIEQDSGANQTQLPNRVSSKKYLQPTSDIVALMVLEHQSQMHNAITRAAYETRMALHYQGVMNKALERPEDFISESTTRRIHNAGDNLLRHLLFADEAPLYDQVEGNPEFIADFKRQAKRDSQGRSLRDFDLKKRMFTYPCSFLIHSEAFETLPPQVRDYVEQRLVKILTGKRDDPEFANLSERDRQNILSILTETMLRIAELTRLQSEATQREH